MNTELIERQIKELDTENKIKDIYVTIAATCVFVELDDTFRIVYFSKLDKMVCGILDEESDNAILYIDNEVDNIDIYINIATFFKANKENIKAIIKNNLQG